MKLEKFTYQLNNQQKSNTTAWGLWLFYIWISFITLNNCWGQKLTIPGTWKDKPLNETLDLLQKQYSFEVSFNAFELSKMSLQKIGKYNSISDFLSQELSLHQLTFKQIGNTFVIHPKTNTTSTLQLKLLDWITRQPISNAHIIVNQRICTSNLEGYLQLDLTGVTYCQLHIQHLSYQGIDSLLQFKNNETHYLLLLPATINLHDVAVQRTAYKAPTNIRLNGGSTQLSIKSTDAIPNFGGEKVWGLLKSLPGIYAAYEVPTGFLLKGDLPGQSAIRFEDIRCYELEHYLGNISGIMSSSIQEITYSNHLSTTSYGDASGGLLSLKSHSVQNDTLFINLGANRLMADGSFGLSPWKGANLTGGMRKTTRNLFYNGYLHHRDNSTENDPTDQVVNTIEPSFGFSDYNLKLTQKLGVFKAKLTLFNSDDLQIFKTSLKETMNTFQLHDEEVSKNTGQSFSIKTNNKNWRLQWKFVLSHTQLTKENTMQVTYPIFNTFEITDNELAFNNLEEWHGRTEANFKVNSKLHLHAGFEWSNTLMDYTYEWNLITTDEYSNRAQKKTTDFAFTYQPFTNTQVYLGTRMNFLPYTKTIDWEPRLKINQRLTSNWSTYFTTSKQSQFFYPILTKNGGSKNQFHWIFSDGQRYPNRFAWHVTSGIQYEGKRFDGSLQGHYKNSPDVLLIPDQEPTTSKFSPANDQYTSAYRYRALELFLRYKSEYYSSWISYTLADAVRDITIDKTTTSQPTIADQRHEIKLAQQFSYKNWHASLFGLWGTGQPTFVPDNETTIIVRTPNFKRLDFSIFYLWKYKTIELESGVSLQNILNETNSKFTTSIYTPSLNAKGFEFYYEMGALPFTVGIDLRFRWSRKK